MTMFAGTIDDLKDTGSTLTFAAIFLLIVWFLKPVVRNAWMIRNIPGPPGIPLIGNAHILMSLNSEQMHNKFCELYKKHGPLVAFRILSKIVVAINNSADAQIVMMNPKLRNRDPLVEIVSNTFIKDSLFTLRDDEWTARRKLVTTAFRFQIVSTYLETFAKKAEELADRLATVADGRTVDLLEDMSLCTLTGFCETALGYKNELNGEEMKVMLKNFELTQNLYARRMANPLHWPLWIYHLTEHGKAAKKVAQEVFDFVDRHILMVWESKQRIGVQGNADNMTGAKKLQTYTDIFIENALREGKSLPEKYIRSDILMLAVGGAESCASTMSNLLMLVGMYPEHQERLLKEQRAIFGDSLRHVQNEDIPKMPVLEMFLKETLRLYPPIPISPRHISFDLPISNGKVLPAGTLALINAYNIHHDPLNFADPDRFWPERWLPENSVGRHPHAYIPYGAGGRNCVALKYTQLQLKATLSRLLRQFQFTCDYSLQDLSKIEFGIFNKPVVGFKVRMVPRAVAKLPLGINGSTQKVSGF